MEFTDTTWYIQYLSFEDLYYLAELHEDYGIINEYFFETKTQAMYFINTYNIPIKSTRYEEVFLEEV